MNRILKPGMIVTEVLLFFLMTSCDDDIRPPRTSNTLISYISPTEAVVRSQIMWDGGAKIIECGFCWNTSGGPKKADSYIVADEISEKFSGKLKDLSPGTKYFVRSYAINKAGMYYGEEKIFTTEVNKLPSVNPPYITLVTHNKVYCSGGGIEDNTYNILAKGICWSTSRNPTTDDQKVDLENDFGSYFCSIEDLDPGTVYYIRAYATNIMGTSYGINRVIRTYDGYTTDYEGHVYSTVRLGNQEWMNRNLETRYFSNGDKINTTDPPTLNIEPDDNPVYQWAYAYSEETLHLIESYGRAYTWYTANDSRKLCPVGWHLPSLNEWNELLTHMGGDELTYRDFRSFSNYQWDSWLNTGASEGSFQAQMAGFRDINGQYMNGNYGTFWWCATEATSANGNAVYCGTADNGIVKPTEKNKKYGYSVRCVKD
jgi:uncharacterized protein (TIGR02145 family)